MHLENGQRVYFSSSNAVHFAQEPKDTALISFFKLCTNDPFTKTLLYSQVPSYYMWKKETRFWEVDGLPNLKYFLTLGRVYRISPKQQDCFYLRLLLLKVMGMTYFDDLKTFNGETFPTYRETSLKRYLLRGRRSVGRNEDRSSYNTLGE